MSQAEAAVALDRMVDPVSRCLTPEVARRIVALRADPELQARINLLAVRSNEGELTPDEREEYELYVHTVQVIALLQRKARRLLSQQPAPSWMPLLAGPSGHALVIDVRTVDWRKSWRLS